MRAAARDVDMPLPQRRTAPQQRASSKEKMSATLPKRRVASRVRARCYQRVPHARLSIYRTPSRHAIRERHAV